MSMFQAPCPPESSATVLYGMQQSLGLLQARIPLQLYPCFCSLWKRRLETSHFGIKEWLMNVPRACVTTEFSLPRDRKEISVSSEGPHNTLGQFLGLKDLVAKAGVWSFQ